MRALGVPSVVTTMASASSAFAFQLVNPDTNSNGTLNLTDPDQHTQNLSDRFSSGGTSTNSGAIKFGNSTLQFSTSNGRGADFGPSPAIQEKFLQSHASRTVPSQGW